MICKRDHALCARWYANLLPFSGPNEKYVDEKQDTTHVDLENSASAKYGPQPHGGPV